MFHMDINQLNELQNNFRKETFETLELISSKEEQLDYQEKVPYINVSHELFNSWETCYQDVIGKGWYQEAFTTRELGILSSFNVKFENICYETDQELPQLLNFLDTEQWLKLSKAAEIALAELNAT